MHAAEHIPNRHLNDDVREVDLPAVANRTWTQLDEATTTYTARTLVKQRSLKVVLLAMERGSRIPEHRAEGDITVQVMSGRVLFRVGAEERVLERGRLLAVARELVHDLVALEDSEVLLTLGA